jgi:hypothetical protein
VGHDRLLPLADIFCAPHTGFHISSVTQITHLDRLKSVRRVMTPRIRSVLMARTRRNDHGPEDRMIYEERIYTIQTGKIAEYLKNGIPMWGD